MQGTSLAWTEVHHRVMSVGSKVASAEPIPPHPRHRLLSRGFLELRHLEVLDGSRWSPLRAQLFICRNKTAESCSQDGYPLEASRTPPAQISESLHPVQGTTWNRAASCLARSEAKPRLECLSLGLMCHRPDPPTYMLTVPGTD